MVLLLAIVVALADDKTEAPPVIGMVLRSAKGAELTPVKGKARPAADMDLLYAGDVIAVDKDPVTVVFLSDGHNERFLAGKRVTIKAEGGAPDAAVKKLDAKMKPANVKQLREFLKSQKGGATVLRRGQSGGLPMPPDGVKSESLVLTAKPDFSWPASPGAIIYRVSVKQGDKELWSATAKTPALKYPKDEAALPLNKPLTWAVTAATADTKTTQVIGPSRFRVASGEEEARFAGLKELEKSDEPDAWLLAALIYEWEECYGEALRLYERAEKKRPNERRILEALEHYYKRSGQRDKELAVVKRRKELAG